ncbi:MAG: nitroreductase family protein [Candidatus Margulisiibacteriota bacterium]
MNFYELIKNRRSIRDYDPKKIVPDEVLGRILDAGRIAPSAANRQPRKFIVVKNPEVKQRLNECYNRLWFHDAPMVLVVVGYPDQAWQRADKYNSIETDLTIAMDHMILAAEYEGVGTCWIAAFDNELLKDALGLGHKEVVFAITPLGYPREGYVKKEGPDRKALEEVIEII